MEKTHQVSSGNLLREGLTLLAEIVLIILLAWGAGRISGAPSANPSLVQIFLSPAVLIITALGILLVILINRTRSITTGPKGITYHTLLYHLSTSWDNLDHIASQRSGMPPFMTEDWLYLKLPGHLRSTIKIGLSLNQDQQKLKMIPLSTIDANWRAGALGEELRRYAPRL